MFHKLHYNYSSRANKLQNSVVILTLTTEIICLRNVINDLTKIRSQVQYYRMKPLKVNIR